MPAPIPLIPSPRELVIVTRKNAKVRVTDGTITSDANFDVRAINKLLESGEFRLRPLFGLSEDRLRLEAHAIEKETGKRPPDLTVFKKFYAPEQLLEELAERLIEEEVVEAAYVKPGVRPAMWFTDMEPNMTQPPDSIPNFIERQGYLKAAADGGIDARFAWDQPGGGRGTGVKIIDVEGAWRFDHDDLKENQGGVVAGREIPQEKWRNHGTAVLGIFSGDENSRGITGICPEANVCGVSVFELYSVRGWGTAAAIREAASKLSAGNILLLEIQRPGPAAEFVHRKDQFGEIPVEWWPCDFAAIQLATMRNILVVTAGGNGSQDLGDAIYDKPPKLPFMNFPPDWKNPFRRSKADSGSIIVGASRPRNGSTPLPELCRLEFSNFDEQNVESIFDAQAWGEDVTSTGFGNLEGGGGPDEKFWYTARFSGTSSAAPMVAGALGCLQGIRKFQGRDPLTPAKARELLRTTGRPQQDHPDSPASKRIVNRPDLRELIEGLPA